jgi:hypothetical protein
MSRLTVLALRVLLVLLFLGGVLGQAWVIPQFAADMATVYPEVSFLELPYSALAMATVLCAQTVLVALWALLSKVRRDAIFTAHAFRWVNAIIVAGIVATALPLAVEIHLLVVVNAGGPPAIVLLLTGVVIAGAAFVLLMVVMRGLLHAATTLQDELAEVV